MNFKKDYSSYYDLLYQDKNYQAEAQFIQSLIKKYSPQSQKILELGCGTGKHASYLVQEGFEMTGVDLSSDMLQSAEKIKKNLNSSLQTQLNFYEGDVRTIRLEKKFDSVLSLFHVMSYQIKDADVLATLETAKKHLIPGGIFIFDVWYGPAVLSQLPTVRVKRLSNENLQIIRIAEPEHLPQNNQVNVNYTIFYKNHQEKAFDLISETHQMRYFSKEELSSFLSQSHFKILDSFEWMTKKIPSQDTWGVCFVCQLNQ